MANMTAEQKAEAKAKLKALYEANGGEPRFPFPPANHMKLLGITAQDWYVICNKYSNISTKKGVKGVTDDIVKCLFQQKSYGVPLSPFKHKLFDPINFGGGSRVPHPGIGFYQYQAQQSGTYAGKEPRYSEKSVEVHGEITKRNYDPKTKQSSETKVKVSCEVPEWIQVVIKKHSANGIISFAGARIYAKNLAKHHRGNEAFFEHPDQFMLTRAEHNALRSAYPTDYEPPVPEKSIARSAGQMEGAFEATEAEAVVESEVDQLPDLNPEETESTEAEAAVESEASLPDVVEDETPPPQEEQPAASKPAAPQQDEDEGLLEIPM